jgi:tRNA modification GTPase
MFNDDIAAVATPPGEAGIGIIRTSGPGVIAAVGSIFQAAGRRSLEEQSGYKLVLGWIVEQDGSRIDQVLVAIMRSPHSYTGEDVVEIDCHGGGLPLRRCLQRCLQAGMRLAEPGEFTKRAFLNGKMDLSQAEAVVDVIRAKTDRGLKLALQQLQGRWALLQQIEDKLLELNALVEASLDFPEEVGDLDNERAARLLQEVRRELQQIISAGQRNEVYRDGVKVVICGKPNVGKSSLLNALIRQEKAIVTAQPGTTRDVVEDYINIKGIPVKIMDTAGIRITEDYVEKIGIARSRQVIEAADLLIFMVDLAEGISQEDLNIYAELDHQRLIVVANKEDIEPQKITDTELTAYFGDVRIIRAAVINDLGLGHLEDAIEHMVMAGKVPGDGMEIMVNLRQKEALMRCLAQVEYTLQNLGQVTLDCLGVDAWGALEILGEISGKTLKEDVIDRIFQEFCIGK